VHYRIGRKAANMNVMHGVDNFKIPPTTLSSINCWSCTVLVHTAVNIFCMSYAVIKDVGENGPHTSMSHSGSMSACAPFSYPMGDHRDKNMWWKIGKHQTLISLSLSSWSELWGCPFQWFPIRCTNIKCETLLSFWQCFILFIPCNILYLFS